MKDLLYVCECVLMAVKVFEVINCLDTLVAECVFLCIGESLHIPIHGGCSPLSLCAIL